jgi:hypothetical protein
LVQPFQQCQFLLKNVRAAKTIERSEQYVSILVVNVPDYYVNGLIAKLLQGLAAMMPVDYLKTLGLYFPVVIWIPAGVYPAHRCGAGMTVFLWTRANYQRLVSACTLDVTNQLREIGLTHPVRIVRMSNKLVKRYRLNLIRHYH